MFVQLSSLVAYAGAHWQRLGFQTYPRGGDVPEHAPDVEFMAAARAALPDRLDRLDRIRDLHAQWGEQAAEDADGYLDLGRRSVDSSTANPHERRRRPRGRVIACP